MQSQSIALLSLTLCLCHCASQTEQDTSPATKEAQASELSGTCGDATVDSDEECDPAAEAWQDSCDADCQRTSYISCRTARDCTDLNANCAAYTTEPGQAFCASFCEHDADCPTLPGFKGHCNFAWCAVSCDNGACPHGMICSPGHMHLDHNGELVGNLDVCVIDQS